MLETTMMILSVVLLILNIFSIREIIWYREKIKCLNEAIKQFEKLSKEYEAELAEKPSEKEK